MYERIETQTLLTRILQRSPFVTFTAILWSFAAPLCRRLQRSCRRRLGAVLEMSEPANPQQESRAPSFPVKFSDHQRKEHAISCEFAFVSRKPIDGVLVIPSSEDSSVWNGIIFIRCGMLAGAMFRFTLTLQPDFPSTSAIPEVIFDLQIFHPHVFHESRRVDFSRHFPDGWRCEQHHIYHILNYIQRLFFSFDAEPTTAANPEAAMLYNTSRKQFQKIAIETIRKSRELIYDLPSGLDHNAIMMTPWDQSVHETYRQALLNPSSSKKDRKKGVSWMSSNGRFMCDMYPSSTTDNTPTDGSSELSLEEKVERLDVAQ